jgi:ABC-2 type transport system ATP-binding protein
VVDDGELVAVAGRNGSGKSTLLRLLATLVEPTSGEATVAGVDLRRDAVQARARLAFVAADDRSFHWRLTGAENLAFFAALHGVTNGAVGVALARVGLDGAADDAYSTYSTGMRQRLAVARALLGWPAVLLLDEPFRALDAESSGVLCHVLGEAVERGASVLVATHHLEELGSLTNRAIVLEAGRLVHDGPLTERAGA